jgi:hypothetical protein
VVAVLLVRKRPSVAGEESQDGPGEQRHDGISGEVETVTS